MLRESKDLGKMFKFGETSFSWKMVLVISMRATSSLITNVPIQIKLEYSPFTTVVQTSDNNSSQSSDLSLIT